MSERVSQPAPSAPTKKKTAVQKSWDAWAPIIPLLYGDLTPEELSHLQHIHGVGARAGINAMYSLMVREGHRELAVRYFRYARGLSIDPPPLEEEEEEEDEDEGDDGEGDDGEDDGPTLVVNNPK